MNRQLILILIAFGFFYSCDEESTPQDNSDDCVVERTIDRSRGACDETLIWSNQVNETTNASVRIFTTNSIPDHMVGLFGGGQGSLNPNAISEQNETLRVPLNPTQAANLTPLLNEVGTFPSAGPAFAFGTLFSGVELDPVAAEPFPHDGAMDPNANWEWNLEAINISIGLDCNNAHVQPTGKYHYHGPPQLFLDDLNITGTEMVQIGWAADGFPIYYKYGYTTANDSTTAVKALSTSYRLKGGKRTGDGVTAPCGTYDGVYTNDYQYVQGIGDLDEANGRVGVTPEFPMGTYYYVITDDFPSIPRYFVGTPNNSFKIGP